MKVDSNTYMLSSVDQRANRALIVGVIGLVLSAVGLFFNAERFFFAYLTGISFWVTIVVGMLFFVMLHHIVSAKWSVVVRRLTENMMVVIPVLALLFIPVFFGIHSLYHWSHADVVAQDAALQHKSVYLNQTFFVVRTIIYFGIWGVLAWRLLKVSNEQDKEHTESITARMKRISAPGIVLFAFTLSFAGFDWLMSLEAHWYSTIFGVYVFSGGLLAALAALTLVALTLRDHGILTDKITEEHYHDLGKLMFGFTIFWAYIAFSQLLLIWYGNIPEETLWYKHRWDVTSWQIISVVLLFGHFVIPFLALITRAAKRNFTVLKAVAIWLLIMHFVDLYWIILPVYSPDLQVSWMDVTAVVGIGGIVLWYFWRQMASRPVIPINDPKLDASIKFVNQ